MTGPIKLPPSLALSDAERMLWEWYQQWWRRDDMPPKLDDALHIRTAMYFIQLVHHHERGKA